MDKYCCKCKKTLPTTEFHRNATRRDGRATYCKACNRTRLRDYYRTNKDSLKQTKKDYARVSKERRRERYLQFMQDKPCKNCGIKDVRVMTWHHVNPNNKKTDPSQLLGRSWELFMKEIAKCIPLCRNCHAIEHSQW